MDRQDRNWENLKSRYLRDIRRALSGVKGARVRAVLDDVSGHLDQRLAELEPARRTPENLNRIIAEMGPASDYAELLAPRIDPVRFHLRSRPLLALGLLACIAITGILLPTALSDDEVAYVIRFKPVAPFDPQTPRELLDAFNENHPKGARTHHFRTAVQDNTLVGLICVDTQAESDAIVKMIETSGKLTLLETAAATEEDFEKHRALGQVSLISEQEAETYIVTFKPIGPSAPRTARALLGAFNQNHPPGVRTHHYRTRVEDDVLIGIICVDTEAGRDAVAEMLRKSDTLELVEIERGTENALGNLYQMGQPSLEKPTSQESHGGLTDFRNRTLLDAETLEALRRHEQYTAGWFGAERAYEAASEQDKREIIARWMTEAAGDDFDKMTRAIAALGNVAAKEAVDVLMRIGDKPKRGNRPRWMAVRALGRIADHQAVPLLINLLDHYNTDTRLYVRVALCEIAGVYFGDSREKWSAWAKQQGIKLRPPRPDRQPPVTRPRNRPAREPQTRNRTVTRSGHWPGGNASIRGGVYRKASSSRVGHGKVCLESAEYGVWVVEMGDHGDFEFQNLPPGVYTLKTTDTFGYKDTYYEPLNQGQEQPEFQLEEGQRVYAQIRIEPARPYRKIAGRITGQDGRPPAECSTWSVTAWVRKPQGRWQGHLRRLSWSGVDKDGSYILDELDGRPVYVQVRDPQPPNENQPFPPCFYPGTFSRSQAKLVTFGDAETVTNIDIAVKRHGGLAVEGVVTDEGTGAPVPEALVTIFHADMFFDLYYAYADEQGRYHLDGLGVGTFIVHVDARHRGYVKSRRLLTIGKGTAQTRLDFSLRRGATIGGNLVDEQGNPYRVGRSSGYASRKRGGFAAAASNFRYGNKHAPDYIRNGATVFYEEGEGDASGAIMTFPKQSSFLLSAVAPGEIVIGFRPRGRGERVSKILYRGRDIRETGLAIEAGQNVEDVTIVIQTASGG
ncbi:MAG: carboxypeptidase regulatory-like domain-containing protein [Sedimentisphaerales bacterium]|nr:carboxypeptidase regulatory-like domain-containing protein [Sedimentisphaerales bacterium]